MLRKIVQTPRLQLADGCIEPWVDWIQRSTRIAERQAKLNGVVSWTILQKRNYWKWAGHIARCEDDRWTHALLNWIPHGNRRVGHPRKRWSDDVNEFCSNMYSSPWQLLAQSREAWAAECANFSNHH